MRDRLGDSSKRRPAGARGDADRASAAALAKHDERVGMADLRRERRAQRPGREDEAVADPALRVDDDEGEILPERRILEAVVHDHDIGAELGEELRTGRAVDGDHGRRELRQEQRFVAHLLGGVNSDGNAKRPALPAAVAAREEARIELQLAANARHFERGRRLSRSADDEVADADNRHVERRARARHQMPADLAVDVAERRQREAGDAVAMPPEFRRARELHREDQVR